LDSLWFLALAVVESDVTRAVVVTKRVNKVVDRYLECRVRELLLLLELVDSLLHLLVRSADRVASVNVVVSNVRKFAPTLMLSTVVVEPRGVENDRVAIDTLLDVCFGSWCEVTLSNICNSGVSIASPTEAEV
jgi:hypothetical protein